MTYGYDVIILGGGGAGIAAAEGAKAAGARKICIVEPADLGGECPHRACVPTKALLASVKLFRAMKNHGAHFGVKASLLRFDFKQAMARKNEVKELIVGGGRLAKYLKSEGVEVLKGKGYFDNAHTIRVGSKVITGKSIVIATGSIDVRPPIAGIDEVEVLSYADVVDLPRLPKSMAIIGGGPVGCEFATFFSSVGVKTTLLQHSERILAREDGELSLLAEQSLKELGTTVLTKTKTLGLRKDRKGTRVTFQTGRRPRQYIWVEAVLLAAGKKPNIEHLGLERAKTKKHIFYAGDASGHMMFTHTAHYEGFMAGWNAAHGRVGEAADLSVIPRVTFIDPELASVGMTHAEAASAGRSTKVYKAPVRALARGAIDGKQSGLLKVVVDTKNDEILGAHMFGERSGEVIHELALAMRHHLKFTDVRAGIRAYPTYSEIISVLQ